MVCGQAAQVDVGEPGSDRFSVSTWVANRGERNALVQRCTRRNAHHVAPRCSEAPQEPPVDGLRARREGEVMHGDCCGTWPSIACLGRKGRSSRRRVPSIRVDSVVTGLYPSLGYKATDRNTVWRVAGSGTGLTGPTSESAARSRPT